MTSLDDFSDIMRRNEPLAPYTWLKIGGPAQYFFEPHTQEQLAAVVKYCSENEIPVRILGSGSNLLVRDEGVSGAVIKLSDGIFSRISIDGTKVTAGAGALLSHLISRTIAAGLAGLEVLSGIPGTVGGALRGNAGGRNGEISEFVKSVTVLTNRGEIHVREAADLHFEYRHSNLDDMVILSCELELHEDDPDEITKRLRKLWISKKASQPLTEQSAGCIFKNPRGMSAGALIEQSGLKDTRIGDCAVSDRHANFIVTYENATSKDALSLIDLIKAKVAAQHSVDLEVEIKIWP